MKLSVRSERWPTTAPIRITGKTFEHFDVVVVQLEQDGIVGQGEGVGVYYLGDSAERALPQIEALRGAIAAGIDRTQLQALLPPGCARNAVDAALWDLQAKASGQRVWELAGVTARTLETQYTLGIESTPEATAQRAREAAGHRLLKLKVNADAPLAHVQAVRQARPDARLVVDANQAWTLQALQALAPHLAELDVHMIEQPLPRGQDAGLDGWRSPVPLCADESCQHIGELDTAAARYQLINIKLDKVGGLTAGLELARAAQARGLGVMVGCMGGTSLAMAPALVLACACEITDLDGPLWQRSDRLPGVAYQGGRIPIFPPQVWG
jgi:L-alanine-DL-glutamate epimerase-like enolase superfamily enzyme